MGPVAVAKTKRAVKLVADKSNRKSISADEAGKKLYEIVEGYFDEIGLSEAERDKRYAKAEARVNARSGGLSKR
jgi:hypothetical protein